MESIAIPVCVVQVTPERTVMYIVTNVPAIHVWQSRFSSVLVLIFSILIGASVVT